MKIASIYAITNTVNGKRYVGFTTTTVERRFKQHKKAISKVHMPLYHAFQKHGREAFIVETLYQSTDIEHTLKTMEPHFIKEYDTYGSNGYNATLGGDGWTGLPKSPETKQKMKDAAKIMWAERKKDVAVMKERSLQFTKNCGKYKGTRATEWVLRDPHNTIVRVAAPTKWCKETGLSFGVIWSTLAENRAVRWGKSKGWQLIETRELSKDEKGV